MNNFPNSRSASRRRRRRVCVQTNCRYLTLKFSLRFSRFFSGMDNVCPRLQLECERRWWQESKGKQQKSSNMETGKKRFIFFSSFLPASLWRLSSGLVCWIDKKHFTPLNTMDWRFEYFSSYFTFSYIIQEREENQELFSTTYPFLKRW